MKGNHIAEDIYGIITVTGKTYMNLFVFKLIHELYLISELEKFRNDISDVIEVV